jgi:phosphate transport system protein
VTRQAHDEIEEIRSMLAVAMASLIEAIPRSGQILIDQDLEGAEYQILADDETDHRTLEVEERCTALLALHAPVAGELRRVVAMLRLASEVERSMDLVVNVCRVARRIHGHELDADFRGVIVKIAAQTQSLFSSVLDAFLVENEDAESVAERDREVDQTHREFIEAIFRSHNLGRIDLPMAVQMAVTARFYERIGDHAVNCAGIIHYVVTGEYPDGSALRSRRRSFDETPIGGLPRISMGDHR